MNKKVNATFELHDWKVGFQKQVRRSESQLLILLRGRVHIACAGETAVIEAKGGGRILAFESLTPFRLTALSAAAALVFVFKNPLVIMGYLPIQRIAKMCGALPAGSKLYSLPVKPVLTEFLQFTEATIRQDVRCGYFDLFSSSWLFHFLRELYTKAEVGTLLMPFFEKAGDFRMFVEGNYARHYSVKKLAERGGFSLSDFKRKFQAEYEETPGKWMNERRKEGILQALKEGEMTSEQISTEFGFASIDYFYKYCKRELGMSVKSLVNSVLRVEGGVKIINRLRRGRTPRTRYKDCMLNYKIEYERL